MRDPARDSPRIFGIIWWNGNDLVGRNGITPYDHPWRYENPHVRRLSERKDISDELICICGISSYIFELPDFVDDF